MSARSLQERMPLEPVPRELQQLVLSFNAMLARLEDAFVRLSNFSADIAHELRPPVSNLIFSRRSLAMLAGASLCFSAVQWSFSAYVVTYLHDSLAYTLVMAGVMRSVGQVAGVAGRLLWGWCADRYLGAVATLALLALLMTLGSVSLALLPAGPPAIGRAWVRGRVWQSG